MSFQTSKTVKSKMIAPAFVSGSHSNISFAYDENNQVVNATASAGGGGSSRPTVSTINSFVSNAYTISSPASSSVLEEIYLISNGSTAVTINLPTAVGITGMKYQIKRLGTSNVTIDANSTETIDGQATVVLYNQYSSATLISNNSNWSII
jgi:hypothetical protein